MRSIRKMIGLSNRQNGFTLMEVVVAFAVIVILSVVVADIIYLQATNFNQVFNRAILLAEWRKTLAQLRVDVQEIDTDNISTMKNNRLTFNNFDGENIDYEYSSNILNRNGVKVAEWVQSDPFQYLDDDQNVTTDADSLNFIRVSMNLSRNGKNVKLSELLYIRN